MPLVISHKAKRTFYVRTEEILGEILGHSNFDGEEWAVGDVIVFEDGTVAVVERQDRFHVWSDPKKVELQEVISLIGTYGDRRVMPDSRITSFAALFEAFSAPPPKKTWWRTFT